MQVMNFVSFRTLFTLAIARAFYLPFIIISTVASKILYCLECSFFLFDYFRYVSFKTSTSSVGRTLAMFFPEKITGDRIFHQRHSLKTISAFILAWSIVSPFQYFKYGDLFQFQEFNCFLLKNCNSFFNVFAIIRHVNYFFDHFPARPYIIYYCRVKCYLFMIPMCSGNFILCIQ